MLFLRNSAIIFHSEEPGKDYKKSCWGNNGCLYKDKVKYLLKTILQNKFQTKIERKTFEELNSHVWGIIILRQDGEELPEYKPKK